MLPPGHQNAARCWLGPGAFSCREAVIVENVAAAAFRVGMRRLWFGEVQGGEGAVVLFCGAVVCFCGLCFCVEVAEVYRFFVVSYSCAPFFAVGAGVYAFVFRVLVSF